MVTDDAVPAQAPVHTAGDPLLPQRSDMLLSFLKGLDQHNIRYVILSGLDEYPNAIDSDVDLMVSPVDLLRLTTLLHNGDMVPNARLVQRLDHETSASYFVLARRSGPHIAYLHPDASHVYRRGGRLWLHSEALLTTRRRDPRGFYVPAAKAAFEYYWIKRVDKGAIGPAQFARLHRLFEEDREGAGEVLARRAPDQAKKIAGLLATGNADALRVCLPRLQSVLRDGARLEPTHRRPAAMIGEWRRRAGRALHPSGFVVAVLGPDGSGKTTIIEHVEASLAPAFRRGRRFHLWPRFGGGRGTAVTDPHAQTPRGPLGSLGKLGYNLGYYWIGWVAQVVPAKMRSTLVIFDRYADDMAIDWRRYRLPPDFPPTRLMARLAPRPDLWLVLQAAPEQLVARKGEVTLDAARDLVGRYARFASGHDDAVMIDTAQSLDDTLAQVSEVLIDRLAARARLRGNHG